MSRSSFAFAATLGVFALVSCVSATENELGPYEYCVGEGGTCTCDGTARFGYPLDNSTHPEGTHWVGYPNLLLESASARYHGMRTWFLGQNPRRRSR